VPSRFCIVGDVHGYLDRLTDNLQAAGLIDDAADWCAGDATLAVLGDLVDRGPDGIGVIDLLMRLQHQARRAGGSVQVVIGNHDLLLVAAHKFGEPFHRFWCAIGGQSYDLARLEPEHVSWITTLPALVLEHEHLLMHADSTLYFEYGASLDAVNARFKRILSGDDASQWRELLDRFASRGAFVEPANVDKAFATFCGTRIVHGHTPIAKMTNQPPETVTQPYVYADGKVINVDPGLYRGGQGFVFEPLAVDVG
jgi:Calcineurin-like phosphoesterase